MGKPAARLTDTTAHGGLITSPGCPTVLIGKMPAARLTDMHMCPMVTPATPPIPHVGGPIVGPGCPTVLIGKMPAATMGDMAVCVGPPSTILMGCITVLIGPAGSAGGGGGGGGGGGDSSAQAATASSVTAIQGTETFPIDIQVALAKVAKYQTPEETQLQIQLIQDAMSKAKDSKKHKKLTIADLVEILKAIEKEESYEAARFFAGYLDYSKITSMAMAFIKGTDSDSKNDPNQMPTRFMLIYGADDAKLKDINDHPDKFKDDHKINVANLRKGLKLLGYDVKDTGAYDDEVLHAHLQYIATVISGKFEKADKHVVKDGEDLGSIAHKYMMPSWKYLYEKNKDKVGDNPDLLKPDTELVIPQWDFSKGEDKIKQKDADPHEYTGGAVYRYPWVALSLSIEDEKGEVKQFEKEQKYEIYDENKEQKVVLSQGTTKGGDTFRMLVPDAKDIIIGIHGITLKINDKIHTKD
jgi:uncharacterized Zn-binding protein involved in type VI secretion